METSGRRYRHSLIGPIVLIGAGVLLLLNNLGRLPGNAWLVLFRLWPLLLILIGFDILVGRRSTAGWLFSALVTLVIVGGVIGLLVFAGDLPQLAPLTEPLFRNVEAETFTVLTPLEGNERAKVIIDWNPGVNTLSALPAGSANLIEGQVTYFGDLAYSASGSGGKATISLNNRITSFNFGSFDIDASQSVWTLALHPSVSYELNFDTGSGDNDFDLSGLTLEELVLDSGSGEVSLALPGGEYRVSLDGGSGDVRISLPEGVGVRVVLDGGSGDFQPVEGMSLVSGDEGDGVWETANFDEAALQIVITIDQGSGDIVMVYR